MPTEINNIRSENYRDFIGTQPLFLVRWGGLIFLIIFISLCISSYFIKTPDILFAKAILKSGSAPNPLISKQEGRIVKLLVDDNQKVQIDEIIGYMESTSNHNDILRLSAILDTFQFYIEKKMFDSIPIFWNFSEKPFSKLGELQQHHQNFMHSYYSFIDCLSNGILFSKIELLKKDLQNTTFLLDAILEQKGLHLEELNLVKENFEVHDTLHSESILSSIDYRGQQSLLINKKMSIPQMNVAILSNRIQQDAIKKEMVNIYDQINKLRIDFIESLNTYRNLIEDWKKKYILTAPSSGVLKFSDFFEEGRFMSHKQIIGYIFSEIDTCYAQMTISQRSFGKIKVGQKVLLKFASYPNQEFGYVSGKIEMIKNITTDSGFLSLVSFPKGLVTNYGKKIIFVEGISADAEIITESNRLSDRLWGKIRAKLN
ncbi:MAG: HlyD family efflux transporter periplasmic adaptor subunit [Sphingobacteriales bacterium]|nr:HlyD family efflux transporter periplasmic adaptor subunit [Sphingobacteriales bacterium]